MKEHYVLAILLVAFIFISVITVLPKNFPKNMEGITGNYIKEMGVEKLEASAPATSASVINYNHQDKVVLRSVAFGALVLAGLVIFLVRKFR